MKKKIFTIILLTVISFNAVLGQFKLDATGANDMRLRTNNIDRVNILTNGNVGMGVTAPVTRLHLDGDSNDGTTATLKITSGGSSSMLFDSNEIDAAPNGTLFLNNNSSGNLNLVSGGGKVGVGITSADSKLHVYDGSAGVVTALAGTVGTFESSTNTYLSILSPSSALGGLLFASPSGTLRGSVLYNHAADLMTFGTANATRLSLDGSGNVGIGTITPDTKLHVEGTVDNNGTTATFKVTNGGSSMLFDGNEIDVASNGALYLNNNSTGNIILADSPGSVGVGTNVPDTKFHVVGTVDNDGTTATFKISNGASSLLFDGNEIDGAGNGAIFLNNNSTGGVYIGANGTGLKEIIKVTANVAAFNVPANGCIAPTVGVANSALNSTVYISPDGSMAGSLMISYARVSVAGTVLFRVCNVSGAVVAQPALDYHITVIR